MKLKIFDAKGNEKGDVVIPAQFSELYRPDLIKKAVLVIQNNRRQPYGADQRAGKKHSAFVSKRRHAYRGTYGIGQSRTPRKVLSSRGTRFNWVGAFAPQTVGGRKAHSPKADKIWTQNINKKENMKAIRSALSMVFNLELVKQRNTNVPKNYPFIIADDFNAIAKTSDLKESLNQVGFKEELMRIAIRKIRSGIGKLRGRKYQSKSSILFVVADDCKLLNAVSNLNGVDIVNVHNLNAELLAPGTHAGRIALFTESAIKLIDKKKLYTLESLPKIDSDNEQGKEDKKVKKKKPEVDKRKLRREKRKEKLAKNKDKPKLSKSKKTKVKEPKKVKIKPTNNKTNSKESTDSVKPSKTEKESINKIQKGKGKNDNKTPDIN